MPKVRKKPCTRHPSLMRNLVKMPPGFEFEDCDKVGRVNQRFVFGPFRGVEITLVCPLTEHFDPRLHRLIDTEGNQTSSRLRVEAQAQWFQKAVKPGNGVHAVTLTQPMRVVGEGIHGSLASLKSASRCSCDPTQQQGQLLEPNCGAPSAKAFPRHGDYTLTWIRRTGALRNLRRKQRPLTFCDRVLQRRRLSVPRLRRPL